MKQRWWLQALCALLVLAAGGVGFWLGRDAAPASTQPAEGADAPSDETAPVPSVQVATITNGTVRRSIDVYGTVQTKAGSAVTLTVPYDAIVQHILVRPGVTVAADTPLIELGPTAEATLQLQQARDAVTAADRNLEDVRRRLSEQLATNADVATAEQAQQSAKTQLASLQQRGIEAKKTLNAGAAGVVAPLTIQQGQVVPAGTALLTIEDDRALEAVLGVEPTDVAQVKAGDSVVLRDARGNGDGAIANGQIRLVSREVDPQTRLQNVIVELPDDAQLPRGTFVDASLELSAETGLVVPRAAVLPDDDDNAVFVVKDDKATRYTVEVVARGRGQCVVKGEGLSAGDAVVVVGNAELEDGMEVKVESPTTEATTQSTTAPTDAGDKP